MTNNALPVAEYRDQIVEAVRDHAVTIITAETGAGKSTQVPQYLLDAGYDIIVTQPRRLAARTVASRVAEEFGTPFGEIVGYRTAYERQDSEATRCLFVTDGLALVRELMGAGHHSVLVLDEVHEWNLNLEVLVAWARHQVESSADFKLVLMSATLEAERLASYFGGAPVISVPGRTFPVTDQAPAGRNMEADIATLLRQGRNVLVFQPGKREIGETIDRLRAVEGLNAELLALHGELTPEEQARCFRTYTRPKCVVSTNVAQTSVTIPDIDAVVDSGLERRVELADGVEGLYLKPISHSDSAQRKGRAGRTKPGVYVDWCATTWDERLEFPKAEILRTRLDQTVLRLAVAGFDAEALEFFHQPDTAQIHKAREALVSLGCVDQAGAVTRIGRLVAKLPISVQYARMVVEADRLGVVDDVITVAAILEQGEINARVCSGCRDSGAKSCRCWLKLAPGETTSDVLAQLAVYRAASGMKRDEMMSRGIFTKAFYQAKEKRRHLADALRGKVKFGSSGKRDDILRAVCAGMVDHLYVNSSGIYRNGDGVNRQLAKESVVGGGQWIVGQPWDLQIQTRRGPTVLRLVRMASKVDPQWLAEVAPQLAKVKAGLNPRYDQSQDEVVSTTETWFNGQLVERREVLDPTHAEAHQLRRDGRQLRQWQSWTDRPEIALPEPADGSAVIPEVVICTYGVDGETGEPLLAYGTVAPYGRRWYSSDPWFRIMWYREGVEANTARERAVTSLRDLQATAKAEAEAEAKKARERAEAEAEAEAEAKALAEAESLGLPSAVSIWRRMGGVTNRGNGWVIRPDGTEREPDSNPGQGHLVWNQILPGELVLRYHQADRYDIAHCEIVYRPDQVTPAQLAVAKQIEEEMGAPENAFGLDDRLGKLLERRIAVIEEVMATLPESLRPGAGWDYQALASVNGIPVGNGESWTNHATPFDEHCEGREAQVVYAVPAADGELVALTYYKWGGLNTNLLWRETTDSPPVATPAPDEGGTEPVDMEDALAGLLDKFGPKHR